MANKHMEKCSTSVTLKLYLVLLYIWYNDKFFYNMLSVGENAEQLDLSYVADWSAK